MHKIKDCLFGNRNLTQWYLVPADCINKVISQKGDRIPFGRLPRLRPAPRVTLRSSWHSQHPQPQPQQQISESASSSVWKQMRDTESSVNERPKFEIDLREVGVPHGAILNDEEQMKEINTTLEKLTSSSCTKSIRDDLKKKGDMISTEKSSRVIYEMGTMELFELGQISVTIQCHSCLKHVSEGQKCCGCGVCLRPDEDIINRIRARFQALIVPFQEERSKKTIGKQ